MTPLRLDRLLGREVYTLNGHRIGRLEEFRAERRGREWVVTEYVIGVAGVLERLGFGVRLVLGLSRAKGYVAQWDQIDLRDEARLRLTCSLEALRPLNGR